MGNRQRGFSTIGTCWPTSPLLGGGHPPPSSSTMTALRGAHSQTGAIAHTRAPTPVLMGQRDPDTQDKWGRIPAGEPLGWLLLCGPHEENQHVT